MKKILVFFFLIVSIKSFAQTAADEVKIPYPVKDSVVIYEKITEVPGKPKEQIYTRVLAWYLGKYKGLNNELKTNDVSIGQLAGNGTFVVSTKAMLGTIISYDVNFDLQVDVKDGKYRCRIYNIRHTQQGKKETDLFAKYLVNVPAETDIAIVKGQKKGYSKKQKQMFSDLMASIDYETNEAMDSLNSAINKKAEDF